MLKLSADQVDLLEQLQVRRMAAAMATTLSETWPGVTQRLTDRWPAFVEAAMQQARRHGIADSVDFARWVSLWCLWGANFDERPGFEWAREILLDRRRRPTLKMHQLLHRTREELRALPPPRPGAPPGPTLAGWDAAIARLTQGAGRSRDAASVFLVDDAPTATSACDLGVVDMKLVDAPDHHEYRAASGGLVRQPAPPPAAELIHLDRDPEAALSASALGRAVRGGAAAKLNLRVQPLAVCDHRRHPELVLNTPAGPQTWSGRDALQLAVPLPPPPEPPAMPGIGFVPPCVDYEFSLRSCGLRDRGAPFESVRLLAHVHSAAQRLFDLQVAPLPAMQWPGAAVEAIPPPRMSVECDGAAANASQWSAAWAELPIKLHAGFEKLFNAFAKNVVGQATQSIGVQAMTGSVALTWGARRVGADEVVARTEGRIDLVALEIDGQLAGEIERCGTRARVRLLLRGRCELKQAVQQAGAVAAEGQGLGDANRNFKVGFSIEVDPLHDDSLGLLSAGIGDPAELGGLSGRAGLRPREDGLGQEWFFSLALEPCTVPLVHVDPICGRTSVKVPLLPALPLLDWKAG